MDRHHGLDDMRGAGHVDDQPVVLDPPLVVDEPAAVDRDDARVHAGSAVEHQRPIGRALRVIPPHLQPGANDRLRRGKIKIEADRRHQPGRRTIIQPEDRGRRRGDGGMLIHVPTSRHAYAR